MKKFILDDETINDWIIRQEKYPDEFITHQYETMDREKFLMEYGREIENMVEGR